MPKIHKYNYTFETTDNDIEVVFVELCFCYTVRGKKLTLVNIEIETLDIRRNTFWRGCTWEEFDDFKLLITDDVELEMVKKTGIKPSVKKRDSIPTSSGSLYEDDKDDNPEGSEQ